MLGETWKKNKPKIPFPKLVFLLTARPWTYHHEAFQGTSRRDILRHKKSTVVVMTGHKESFDESTMAMYDRVLDSALVAILM